MREDGSQRTGDPPMWTLWLITFGSVLVQGGAPATVTPLSTYATNSECFLAIEEVTTGLKRTYPGPKPLSPGLMFCVPGAPVKK